MRHIESLNRLRSLFRREADADGADALSGPTLIQQEPDLAQEAARHVANASAWAASGTPTD